MRTLLIYLSCCSILLSGSCLATIEPASASFSTALILEQATAEERGALLVPGRFESLIDASEYYAALGDRGWAPLSAGPVLYPGQRHAQVAELRFMLNLYGDYHRPATGRLELNLFDAGVAEALRSFQRRNGLEPDAVLGPETRQALNVSPQVRSYQLLLNFERQRPLAKRRPKNYVQVNLPEFQLRFYQDEQSVLEMKTIIGRQSRSTPTFDTEIRSLVVNPGWNIPRSIAYQDILPKWQANADYLGQHNIRIVSGFGADKVWIDAKQTEPKQLYQGRGYPRLYQLPGRDNALGKIKFDSPSSEAIYLHDTPVKSLFNRSRRAFSSGCIRIENPRLLARYLLDSQPMKEPLDELWAGTDTRRIRLQNPVGLYLTYWTAWLDPQQGIQFRNDIYQRDQRQQDLLELGQLSIEVSDGF